MVGAGSGANICTVPFLDGMIDTSIPAVNILASALEFSYSFSIKASDVLGGGFTAPVRRITGAGTGVDVNIVSMLCEGTDTSRPVVKICVCALGFKNLLELVFEATATLCKWLVFPTKYVDAAIVVTGTGGGTNLDIDALLAEGTDGPISDMNTLISASGFAFACEFAFAFGATAATVKELATYARLVTDAGAGIKAEFVQLVCEGTHRSIPGGSAPSYALAFVVVFEAIAVLGGRYAAPT